MLAVVLQELGNRPKLDATNLLLQKLDSDIPAVRATAIAVLGKRKSAEAASRVTPLLKDAVPQVQEAAAVAAGQLAVHEAAPLLLNLAKSENRSVQRASLESLRTLKVDSAVRIATAAINHPETQLVALNYLNDFGNRTQAAKVFKMASTSRSSEVLAAVVKVLTTWRLREKPGSNNWKRLDRTIQRVQGQSGILLDWSVLPAVTAEEAAKKIENQTISLQAGWSRKLAAGSDAVVQMISAESALDDSVNLAVAEVIVEQPTSVEFLGSSNGRLQVWLNGKSIFKRDKPGKFRPNTDKFQAALSKGTNRILLKTESGTDVRFHLHFRRKSSKAEHEQLTQLALSGKGSVTRGRETFLNAEKSQCIKCHRLGDKGGKIGPDLAGIGSRFSRIHIIESILEPSRTVAPSYGSMVVVLKSGKVITGVKVSETAGVLKLGDNQGKTHDISKADIEEMQTQKQSIMPEGLEKKLTDREFIDLLAFLLSQKKLKTK